MFRTTSLAVVAAVGLALGCSWDYPAWPKSKLSDTALFRFVVNDRDGAGYIDRTGKVVIAPRYQAFTDKSGGDFFEGLARVEKPNRRSVFIDAAGAEVMDAEHVVGGEFSEGLIAEYSPRTRKYGYVDRRGVRVIPPRFDDAGTFREGLARVSLGGRFGFVDRTGKLVIPAKFHYVTPFSEGLAVVIETGSCARRSYLPCEGFFPLMPTCKYSVIDKTGNVVWRSRYVDAKPFSEGLSHVQLERLLAVRKDSEFFQLGVGGAVGVGESPLPDGRGSVEHFGLGRDAGVRRYVCLSGPTICGEPL